MTILKWFSFVLVFTDFVGYILRAARKLDGIGGLFGFVIGILCRAFVLYGTITCWLLG